MSTVIDTQASPVPTPDAARRRRPKIRPFGYLRALCILVVCAAFVFPFLWMLLSAFKTNLQISDPSQAVVFTPTLDNFAVVFQTNAFVHYLLNSVLVAVASTALSLVLGVPAAWAIAKFHVGTFNGLILLARIVPAILLLVPWYIIFSNAGLVGSYWALILSHMFVSLPLITWVMTGFFSSLPVELDETGQVDGLSQFGCFWRIALPLSVPGMVTAAILAVIFSWNNFLFSLILADQSTTTLPVALYQFISYASVDWGGLMAAATVMTAPIIGFALVAQRYVVAGLTAGATKG